MNQILSSEEIFLIAKEEGQKLTFKNNPNIDIDFARAIEKAILSKLNSAEPVAWRFVDDEDACISYRSTPPSKEVVAYLSLWNRPAWQPLYEHPPAPSVPDGYQLVPIEPTDKMLNAASKDRNGNFSSKSQWDSMLAAARSGE